MTPGQQAVLAGVVAARLVVPLFIPKFPLPAILAALVIDGLDQSIFQWAGMASVLDNYQSYDKALDVYYLVIAYTATLRNWTDPVAFRVGQGLWYWRLAGVVIFELSGWRPVLLIFPNTFEYFFIAYEAVRTLWRPTRLSRRALVGLAAAIWIVIKLPQEWWIHVAQLDATEEIQAHPALSIVLLCIAVAVLGAVVGVSWRRIPRPDWRFTVAVDAHQPERSPDTSPEELPMWLRATGEKVVLTAAVVVIFAHILPTTASIPTIAIAICVVSALNAGLCEGLEWRNLMPTPILARFAVTVVVNAVIYEALVLLRGRIELNRVTVAVFLLLISVIITLFDQFRGIRNGITVSWPKSRPIRSSVAARRS